MLTKMMGRSTAVIYLNSETNLIKDIPTIYVSYDTGAIMMIVSHTSWKFMQQSYPFQWNDVGVPY
jgi:hypothetical protein